MKIIRIQLSKGTAAQWAASTRILSEGEPAWETENRILKIGNGVDTFADLPVANGGSGGGTLDGLFDTDITGLSDGEYLAYDAGSGKWVNVELSRGQIKTLYESNSDTNAFTDADRTKLDGIGSGAEANTVDSVNGKTGAVVIDPDDLSDTSTANKFVSLAQRNKLDGIEDNATADQTGAEIKAAYEAELDVNRFSDADKSKLDAIEAGATGDMSNSEIRDGYEANADVNRFSDSDKSKLDGIESGATGDQTGPEIKVLYEAEADVNRFSNSHKAKLDGIEDNATADQTGAEIKAAYEGEADTNAFTNSDKSKLDGIESGATADQTSTEIRDAYEINSDVNRFSDADKSKLDGIEAGATGDQTGAEIKAAYEGEVDTNAFTDAEKSKLSGVEANATEDQSPAEIEAGYNAQVPQVTGPEKTAGTETSVRRVSPADVKDMIDTHAGGAGDATQIRGDDISTDSVADGDILVYRQATGKWEKESKPAASGNPDWGDIQGTLSSQTDLQNALDDKLESGDIADFEDSAALNARDTANRDRANHTGTQPSSTISNFDQDVESGYNAQVPQVTGPEKTAGNEAGVRRVSPADIKDMVEAHAPDQTGAEIKAAYEAEANTNAYTDAEKTKLSGIAAGAEVNAVDSVNGQQGNVVLDPDDLDDTSTAHKFMSAAEQAKLSAIAEGAEVNTVDSVNGETGAVTLNTDDIDDSVSAHKFASLAQLLKLDNIEPNATADQTGAEIKTAYEAEANTNAYTDAEKSKLSGIASGAEVNAVDSVNGQQGGVVLDADDIDDTSTAHKFMSAAEQTKLSAIEDGADVTDEANVTAALDGATLTDVGTPASGDRVLLQDPSDGNKLKYAEFSEFGGASPAGEMTQFLAHTTTTTNIGASNSDLTWDTPVINNGGFTVSTTDVTLPDDGGYLVLATVEIAGAANRVELTADLQVDTGAGFSSVHTVSDYVARDTNQNNGGVTLQYIVNGSQGDKVKINASTVVDGGSTANLSTNSCLMLVKLTGAKGDAGSGADWGGIAGTLSDQTDLQAALDARNNRALASQAEAEAGTENTKGMTALRVAQAIGALESKDFEMIVKIGESGTALTATPSVHELRLDFAFTLTDVRGTCISAPSGGTLQLDIHKNGTTALGNKIVIEDGEYDSDDATAQPTISSGAFASGDILSIDVDISSGAEEAYVYIKGTK